MPYDFSYPGTPPSERGWGSGWPNCNRDRVVSLVVAGVSFPGGIREELHELATLLLLTSLERGYIPRLDDPGCWGGACRDTKRADGSRTGKASNHSWFTALDINAPHNVFGGSSRQIPDRMGDLFHAYGWRWLGPPIGDWMHFDYAGTPADAKRDTEEARRSLTIREDPDEMAYQDFKRGAQRYLKRFRERGGDPGPAPKSLPADVKFGWNLARAGVLRGETPLKLVEALTEELEEHAEGHCCS